MRTFLFLIFTLISLPHALADQVELVFRFYKKSGMITPHALSIQVKGGKAETIGQRDRDGWQSWNLTYGTHPVELILSDGEDTVLLELNVHPSHQERLRTLIVNRLQAKGDKQILMVNHLTCKWTGGVAYPLERNFQNPIDGAELKLIAKTCLQSTDTGQLKINILSDSVLLLTCSGEEGYFIKYYLGSDQTFYVVSKQPDCQTGHYGITRQFFDRLLNPGNRWTYRFENNQFILQEGGCRWSFEYY